MRMQHTDKGILECGISNIYVYITKPTDNGKLQFKDSSFCVSTT